MNCKKCKKQIPDESLYCMWCGAPLKKNPKKKMYQRPDGLYEKMLTIEGKRIAFRGKSETEVHRKILEYQEQEENGRPFCDVADEWEAKHFPTLAPNTLQGYRPAARRAKEYFEDRPLKQIQAPDVVGYINSFPKSWAQKTYQNYMLVLNLIFEYAAAQGYIQHNPAEYVKIPKGLSKTPRRAPTASEIEIIKNNVDKPGGLLAYFLLYTGCRRGEAQAIQFKDVDRVNHIIHITKSVYHEGNAPHIKQPKTEKGIRDIVLLEALSEKLPVGKPNDYIFGYNGSPMTNSKFNSMWREYQKSTGLICLTPHMIRHGYASMLNAAGIEPKVAQYLLGHAQISTTMDIYTHISENQLYYAAKKIEVYTENTQQLKII